VAEPQRHLLHVEQEKALLQKRDRRRSLLFRWATVFSVLSIVLLCAWFWLRRTPADAYPQIQSLANDLRPATTGATLEQPDGVKFALYNPKEYPKAARSRRGQYRLTTRNGQIFSFTLPDSTRVWLDAGSCLIYPAVFTGSQRKVKLSGEAYFEVHPDPRRLFIVALADEAIVKTYRANFNIFAYADEPGFCTSVFKDSAEMDAGTIRKESIHPSQEVTYWRLKELFPPSTMNLKWTLAWKDNQFILDGIMIDNIMKDIERWYDAEIIYDEGTKNDTTRFAGTLPRTGQVSDVLKLVESQSKLRFSIKGHTIKVTKGDNTISK
jgi:hypothetical protein